MKTLTTLIFALISFNTLASTGSCEISYSSTEDYKLRWMGGSEEVLENATLEECVAHAEAALGTKKRWKTLIRKDERKITISDYKFYSDATISTGKLTLSGYEH